MSSFKKNPASEEEIIQWSQNKLVNPRTNRKIKKTSPIYKYFDKEFKKKSQNKKKENEIKRDNSKIKKDILDKLKDYLGPAQGNHLLSFDNKDPISQEDIWEKDDNDIKQIANDIPSYKLFSYQDSEDKIRCFNIKTINSMISNNCKIHPITGIEIDEKSIENATIM